MEILTEVLSVSLRTVISIAVLYVISLIMGERQISQLTYYDYIVGISIGSIAAMSVETSISLWLIIASMVIFGGFALLISFITSKSIVLRRILTGKPVVMIYNGEIIKSGLKKHNYDINDLLLECRIKGYFDISQIQCAIMETNGEISILPKAPYHPLTASDLKLDLKEEYLQYNLIIDGKLLIKNLKAYGKDEKWIKKKLKEQGINKISDVLLCVGDDSGSISAFLQNEQLPHNDFFM